MADRLIWYVIAPVGNGIIETEGDRLCVVPPFWREWLGSSMEDFFRGERVESMRRMEEPGG